MVNCNTAETSEARADLHVATLWLDHKAWLDITRFLYVHLWQNLDPAKFTVQYILCGGKKDS